jgi:hypothetical protein
VITRLLCTLLLFAAAGSSARAQADRLPTWSYSPGFFAPGLNGFVFADLDSDGKQEVVVSGLASESNGPDFLRVLGVLTQQSDGRFRLARTIAFGETEIFLGQIQLDPATDSRPAGIVAVVAANPFATEKSARLVRLSGPELTQTASIPLSDMFALDGVADVDADGTLEAFGRALRPVSLGYGQPQVRDLATGAGEWTFPGDSWNVAAGQLDADAALELVFAHAPSYEISNPDRKLAVIDGASHGTDWSFDPVYGGDAVIGNFDAGSANQEFALVERDQVQVFDGGPQYGLVKSHVLQQNVRQIAVADLDGDGRDELIHTNSSEAIALRVSDWSEVLKRTRISGSRAIAVGQLDADAAPELVLGAGEYGGDYSLVAFNVDGSTLHAGEARAGPHADLLVADLDGDGASELAFVPQKSPRYVRTLSKLDLQNGYRKLPTASLLGNTAYAPVPMLALDMDSDPQLEIVAAQIGVQIIDGLTFAEQRKNYYSATEELGSISLDGDEVPDLILAGPWEITAIKGATGAELWSKSASGAGAFSIATGETDGDLGYEVLLARGTRIDQLSAGSGAVERSFERASAVLDIAIEGTEDDCRIVVYEAASLSRLRCATLEPDSVRFYAAAASFVRAIPDSYGKLVLVSGSRALLQVGDSVVDRSILLGPSLGLDNRGAVIDRGRSVEVYLGDLTSVHRIDFGPNSTFYSGFEGEAGP